MLKLLVVDDEKGLCEYLRDFFASLGYEVSTATDGQEAVTLTKKENPELVLLDINMPGMGGLEVLRRIKAISSRTKVIMITVSDDADTMEKAKSLGADEFVKKPFTTDYLEDVVILKVGEMTKAKEPARILIVDDEKGLRASLREFLDKRFDCEISEAESGQRALELLKAGRYDLVLLDIKMPGISGMDVLKEKKKLGYKPSVWVITRFDSEEVARKAIEQGADDYIPKPFSLRVLDSKLKNFLALIGRYKPRKKE